MAPHPLSASVATKAGERAGWRWRGSQAVIPALLGTNKTKTFYMRGLKFAFCCCLLLEERRGIDPTDHLPAAWHFKQPELNTFLCHLGTSSR